MTRLFALAAVVGLLVACRSNPTAEIHLRILAAQSLAPAFPQIKHQFEHDHKHVKLDAEFGGSSLLATQIAQGAPGDVFVSADEVTMTKVVAAKLVAGSTTLVAGNLLEIAVPAANPKHITELADLTRSGTIVALCDAAVPCGRYAAQVFAKAGFAVPKASAEANVAGVVTKIVTGEADAGVVYVTDVQAAGNKVAGVTIPPNVNVVARYPAAALTASQHANDARAFVAFLRSDAGQRILRSFGFTAP